MIGDESLAREAVEQWYRTNPDSVDAKLNRGTISLRHVDRWLTRPDSNTIESIARHLIDAGKLIPVEQYQLVRDRLNTLDKNNRQFPDFQQLHTRVIEDAETPGLMLEHFGALAALKGEWETSDRLLIQALELNPEFPNPWNNRAYVF